MKRKLVGSASPGERTRDAAWLAGAFVLAAVALSANTAWSESPCQPCHEEQVAAAAQGPHRGLVGSDAGFCSACHGDPGKHLSSGEAQDIRGKAALAGLTAAARSAACLSCHASQWPGWQGTPHARSIEVSCWSCHGDVGHDTSTAGVARRGEGACASCHREQSIEFRRAYHHPVPEGRMGCASCHDVHGALPDGPASMVDRCLGCHQEVSGPYVFPHRAMEDGCAVCHTPHGSVNRSLLATSGNGMCLACHLQSNFPAVGNVPHNFKLAGGGMCYDCHNEVHGSNVDELMAPRFRR